MKQVQGSARGKLNKPDWVAAGKSLYLSLGAVIIAHLSGFAVDYDFGVYDEMIAGAVPPALTILWRYARDYSDRLFEVKG